MSLQEMNLTTFDRRALMRGSAVLLLAIVVSCDAPSTQLLPQTLPELAAAWSGGRSDPVCQNRGPNGEYLGTSPGAQYCQWPTVARGPEWGTVGGHRDSIAGLGLITWERSFRDSSAVDAFRDSLSRALNAQGMREQECQNGGRRWTSERLGVELTPHQGLRQDGMRLVTVFATTIPQVLPNLLCPAEPSPKPSTTL